MRPPLPSADFIRQCLDSVSRRARLLDGYRHAAVLIPLLPADRDWEVLLTRRNSDLPHHKGQVAFPGGSVDAGENCMDAALREAHEEIGLTPSRVEILGCHDDIWTPSGFIISPVVGILADADGLAPNPDEVARMFSVPLSFSRIRGRRRSRRCGTRASIGSSTFTVGRGRRSGGRRR